MLVRRLQALNTPTGIHALREYAHLSTSQTDHASKHVTHSLGSGSRGQAGDEQLPVFCQWCALCSYVDK
jgi:hypothetical protein